MLPANFNGYYLMLAAAFLNPSFPLQGTLVPAHRRRRSPHTTPRRTWVSREGHGDGVQDRSVANLMQAFGSAEGIATASPGVPRSMSSPETRRGIRRPRSPCTSPRPGSRLNTGFALLRVSSPPPGPGMQVDASIPAQGSGPSERDMQISDALVCSPCASPSGGDPAPSGASGHAAPAAAAAGDQPATAPRALAPPCARCYRCQCSPACPYCCRCPVAENAPRAQVEIPSAGDPAGVVAGSA